MPDMGAISGLAASLTAAADITKGMVGLRDTTMVQDKVIELQGVILSAQSNALTAQSEQFSLLERIRALEEKVTGFEAWDTEKQKYELKQVHTGAFAFVLKPEASGGETPHWLCTTCYENNRKSILQAQGRTSDKSFQKYACPTCRGTLRVHYNVNPGKPDQSRTF